MRGATKADIFCFLVLGLVLFASAMTLVELQRRTRLMFVEHEREMDIERRLLDDQADLLMKVRRASLPGTIASGAEELGLVGATGETTIVLVEDEAGGMSIPDEVVKRLREEAAAREAAERIEEAKRKRAAERRAVR